MIKSLINRGALQQLNNFKTILYFYRAHTYNTKVINNFCRVTRLIRLFNDCRWYRFISCKAVSPLTPWCYPLGGVAIPLFTWCVRGIVIIVHPSMISFNQWSVSITGQWSRQNKAAIMRSLTGLSRLTST